MKKRRLAALFLAAASLLALCALAGCASRGESQTEDDPQGLLTYSVWERLDRQNDIYVQAARLLDDYLSSEERDAAEARFQGFCQGVNVMAQDQILYNQFNDIFQGQDTLNKAVKQLVTAPLTCQLDELSLSRLSDEEAAQLRDTLQTLAQCCDRGENGSLAHCIENQTEGEPLTAAITQVTEEIQGLERLTAE
jgi:type IV pilus biogenesis protein CpaD/CtpE